MDFSIYEVLSWVQASATKITTIEAVAVKNASNILLFACCLTSLIIKRPLYLVAFLLVETYGYSSFSDLLSNYQYYLGYAFLYSVIARVAYNEKAPLKVVSLYVTIILFEIGMALDAVFYPQVETVIHQSYTYFVLLIHILICCSLLGGSHTRQGMGFITRA